MRATRILITVLALAVLSLGAVDVAAKKKKPSGADLYKEYCKPCHMADSEAGEYTPMTLIQDQWERFFDEKYVPSHEEVIDPNHDDKPVTEVISDKDLEAIKKFAVDGAADSEHPMTCG